MSSPLAMSRTQAQAMLARHHGDGRVICRCLDCIYAREILAQWAALDVAKAMEGAA